MADLWVQHFEGDPADAVRDLQSAFGLDEETAHGIVHNTPCIVKRDVDPVEAMPWIRALRDMGAKVDLRDDVVRQDPRASLRMPKAKFGRKSLRPSDKGTERPEIDEAAGTIPNPLTEEEEDPGDDGSLDAAMDDVLAEVAKAKPPPPKREVASDPGATVESVPPPFRPSAPSASPQPPAAKPTDGPAVFGPPAGAAPSKVEQPPDPDEFLFGSEEDTGNATLDVSGELDLSPEDSLPPPPAPSQAPLGAAPTPEAAPNAAQAGYGFGEDPLEAPIPEGMLELDVVEPPPPVSARPSRTSLPADRSSLPPDRTSMPSGRPSGRHSAIPDDHEPAPVTSAEARKEQLQNGIGALVAGALIIGGRVAFGGSCFSGTSAIWALAFDAIGLAGLLIGSVLVIGSLRDHIFELAPFHYVAAIVPMFGIAFGLNVLNAPTPEEARAMQVAERNAETEDQIEDGIHTEARIWVQQGSADPAVARLIEALYSSGAVKVYTGGGGRLIVEMPDLPATRASIERAYRRFLGYRLNQVDASLHPDTRYWWITVEFAN